MAQAYTRLNQTLNPHRAGEFVQVYETTANLAAKTITVPANKVWQILHVFESYAADANAANRTITLTVGDGTNTIGYSSAANVQIANATEYYQWVLGATVPVETTATEHFIPFPGPEYLPAGYTLNFDATNDQVGDDSIIRIEVLEYTSK